MTKSVRPPKANVAASKSPAKLLTLKDRLSRLTYAQAVKLLGKEGERLLQRGGTHDIDIDAQVIFNDVQFSIKFDAKNALEIRLDDNRPSMLAWKCSCRQPHCIHAGAAFSLILEEKTALGLAKAPPEPGIVEPLNETALTNLALEERQQRARAEKMRVISQTPAVLWSDYRVTSSVSGKSYRVSLRGWNRGDSYCSCPDFRKNSLGTCKHIMHVIDKVQNKFTATQKKKIYQPEQLALHVLYGETMELRLLVPPAIADNAKRLLQPLIGKPIVDVHDLLKRIQHLERIGQPIFLHPDAEEYVQRRLFQERIKNSVDAIRANPETHSLRENLLKVPLLPYQLDGIAFAVGAGRAILADDMGLGKTIQGIGVAEMLAREANIQRALIITPASLKSQWREEIQKFCHHDTQIVVGSTEERIEQYRQGSFFTICNYEQVMRDIAYLAGTEWDLIILDEGQRIKNWEAKTTQAIKSLKSRFALVLSGTPLENRLDDLFSVVEFIDDRRLGPAFRFFNKHRITDEKGKVIGYKDLAEVRERLKPVLLRRTRASVKLQLPARHTEIIRVAPTLEQKDIHDGQSQIIRSIVNKRYITEMDLLRLQKALLLCRMVADSTYLVDKQEPAYSSKLDELQNLLTNLSAESDRKIVLFSEWTTMLDLIEPHLQALGMDFVRLDGSVPQKQRQALVDRFQKNADCRVFITTNAGSTGLNLQAANTVINVDLPWNPAILEQRIARAHRMGQQRQVQVFILVTQETIEENMLATLSSKHQLALAALDPDTDIDQVDLTSGIDELKKRLEILLGTVPEAPVDESAKREIDAQLQRQQRIAEAGGQMLTAAFAFLKELLPAAPTSEAQQLLASQIKESLAQNVRTNQQGGLDLTIKLSDSQGLDNLAQSIAGLLSMAR